MFDFHVHSCVSRDGQDTPMLLAQAAARAGMKKICFTEHIDYFPMKEVQEWIFDPQEYADLHDNVAVEGLEIFHGIEFGMLPYNQDMLTKCLQWRQYDFVIGSIHVADGIDMYFPEYWEGKTMEQAERRYFEVLLDCLKNHDDFDVLGHLTYISKAASNPTKRPVAMADHQELVDEIFKILIQKGKGIEVNTGGMGPCGVFMPEREYLQRFKELGGQIVTVGSDAHDIHRVGQHCREAVEMVRDIFGYVCTFSDRQPVFHRI